ncbi:hypothetical protein LZ31DRAFT_554239 [Colletotrichum somersetense]|nr:hypothetical protein LZ31DRAFT_554239 [Colletotrichum somersetense]
MPLGLFSPPARTPGPSCLFFPWRNHVDICVVAGLMLLLFGGGLRAPLSHYVASYLRYIPYCVQSSRWLPR